MKKEVAIVGGSAAGFYLARELAKDGHSVRLFEAEKEISPPARTLIVTKHLKDRFEPLRDMPVINYISGFELILDGKKETVCLKEPDLIIERNELIKHLAKDAARFGAEVLTDYRFISLIEGNGRINYLMMQKGSCEEVMSADILIGADGTASKVAQGCGRPDQTKTSLLQAVVKLPNDLSPDTARVWFFPEKTPYFFWLIPHSPDHGVAGLIADEERKGRILLEQFLEKQSLEAEEYQIAWTPKYTRWIPLHKRVGSSDVYLVGDAAGHVKVTTVGGVVTGFLGAKSVAERISGRRFIPAQRQLRWELLIHRMVRTVLNRFSHSDYRALLDLLTPDVKQVLGLYTRDQPLALMIRLLIAQPRLLSFVWNGISSILPLVHDFFKWEGTGSTSVESPFRPRR